MKKFIETLNFCFSHVSSVVDGHVKSFTSPLVLSIGRFARYDIQRYELLGAGILNYGTVFSLLFFTL